MAQRSRSNDGGTMKHRLVLLTALALLALAAALPALAAAG
jgi:hypothetical protein